jgi:hypothetical protein
MKNKLLTTTAICTIALSSFAVAETKITGQLDISYNALSVDGSGADSADGFGRESQINVQKTGDLNNGMKYAAGFALEFDGAPNGSNVNSISNENLYIDFISGNTTLSVGQDHGLNTDSSAVPRVSIPANSFLASAYTQGAAIGKSGSFSYNHVKEGMGVYVAQKFDAGTAQVRYTPKFLSSGGKNDAISGDTGTEGGAYDVNFAGNLGVKGLKVNVQYAKAEKALGSTHTGTRDSKGKAISASYNFGQVTIGAGRIDREAGDDNTHQVESNDFGITIAANDKLSFGLNYIESEVDDLNKDEEITMAQIGYNLGAVGIAVGYADVQNYRGTAVDREQGFVRLSTKF